MINSYSNYMNYKAGAVVKYNGRVFQALVDTIYHYPQSNGSDNEYWQYVPPAGRIFFINKGTYYSNTTYDVLDVVTMNGKRYIAKKTTQGNAPAVDGDNDYWQMIAESGNYRAVLDSDGILN